MRLEEPQDLEAGNLRTRAVDAARGAKPFDLLLHGGCVADVITGQIRPADVGVVGPLIASVHPPGARRDSRATLNAAGKVIAPGLIDTHLHIESSMVTPRTYCEAVLARGVTTIVWDPHEFANVCGIEGVRWAVKQASDAPNRILTLAPSCVPSAPGLETTGADFDADTLRDVLAWPGIKGLAEVMDMRGVITCEPRMTGIVREGLASGKPVFGHARGLSGPDLNAYVAAGVTSDHEITSAEDLGSKLEAGLFIELRGSHDHLLPACVEALASYPRVPQTLTLCTDDVFPDDLWRAGGLDDVLRRITRYGMPAIEALRAATLNAALRLGRHDLGAVAPGRRADLAVFSDLRDFRAEAVIFNGVEIGARDGRPDQSCDQLARGLGLRSFGSEDFLVRADSGRVRVATIDEPRFTRWGEAVASTAGGYVRPPEGSITMAVVNRHGAGTAPRMAFLRGWGAWRGAFCTTVSHDSHNLTVFGSNATDMAVAANAIRAAHGGLAAVADGRVRALLPLPVAGLVSEQPLPDVAGAFAAVKEAMDQIATWKPPYRVFKACFGASLACNPGPHLTDLGITDAETGNVLTSPVLGAA
ncbi:MAG: amidohydrolase family protein [Paracoccaceae bacterium]|nr:amidohydrolase family protein [Paracoccaceae bacterium]